MTEPTSAAPKPSLCDVCWQVDPAPKHVVDVPPDFPGAVPTDAQVAALDDRTDITASMVRAVLDPTTLIRHHDCCAAQGCPTGICSQILEVVGDTQDDSLRELINSGAIHHLSDAEVEA